MSKIDASGMEHGKRGGKVYQEVRGQQIVKNLFKPTYHAATDGHDRVFIDYASPSRFLGTFG